MATVNPRPSLLVAPHRELFRSASPALRAWRSVERPPRPPRRCARATRRFPCARILRRFRRRVLRSEEHTSELQSQSNLVCRLLLEKKKKKKRINILCKKNIIKKND